ncbi:hypothetical protein OU995_08870 [Roseateles sp. SL47]|uniref:hypothetical protein n=1 Tax=Roseateles sp. SL47 TaxID=2995138 RepID=UPI0022701319|nr:hypothetical protein [Roseateles sp. SL47]WAC74792.1 hypothetical protein OU995_08870 [Roseateles sp. SL47]
MTRSPQEARMQAQPVFSTAGRFALPPARGHATQIIHRLHGDRGPVMAPSPCVEGAAQRRAREMNVMPGLFPHLFPDLAHAMDGRVVEKIRRDLSPPQPAQAGVSAPQPGGSEATARHGTPQP